jgi:hypothetical protein
MPSWSQGMRLSCKLKKIRAELDVLIIQWLIWALRDSLGDQNDYFGYQLPVPTENCNDMVLWSDYRGRWGYQLWISYVMLTQRRCEGATTTRGCGAGNGARARVGGGAQGPTVVRERGVWGNARAWSRQLRVGAVRRSVARAQSRRRVGVVQETSELGLRRRIDGSWSLAWILKWWKLSNYLASGSQIGFPALTYGW